MAHPPIQILGAGLTGMSAAHHLGSECEIHERLAHPGGHAITISQDGYRFDRTGHLLHLRDDSIRSWVHELLEGRLVRIARRSQVFSHGVYTRYPYQANTFGLPPEVAYDCLHGFLKAMERQADAPEPKNFEEFSLKYFGEGISKHFMIPYNSKLWGTPATNITADWCSRFVPKPSMEDVVAGAVGMNSRELGYNATFDYPRQGIGELTDAMAGGLKVPVHYNSSPVAIDWQQQKLVFDDREVPYEALVSTAPMDVLVKLLRDPPAEVAAAATKLRCTPLWYLDVALDVPCGKDLHWIYVPEERYPFYRVGCYSNFSSEMAPEGKACLYVELTSREEPDMAKLLPQVASGLRDMGIIREPGDIKFAQPRHIGHAYVLYDHDYYPATETIMPFLEENRIVSCGRYGGWNYSSMEDALIFGRDGANKAKELRS